MSKKDKLFLVTWACYEDGGDFSAEVVEAADEYEAAVLSSVSPAELPEDEYWIDDEEGLRVDMAKLRKDCTKKQYLNKMNEHSGYFEVEEVSITKRDGYKEH